MRENTKFNLKNIFGSPFNNTCAINAARTLPWWSAIIVLLLGVLLPIIPLVVSVANSSGASYISGTNNYGYDRDLTAMSLELHAKGEKFKVTNDHLLEYYVNGEQKNPTVTEDMVPIARYVNTNENQYELDIYFSNRELNGTNGITGIIDSHSKIKYQRGTLEVRGSDVKDDNSYIPSFVVFYKGGLVTVLYKHNSVTALSGTSYLDWKNTAPTEDLLTRVLKVEGFEIPVELDDLSDPYKYIDGVYANYKVVYNEGYTETKNRMYLVNSTVYFGVYFGLVIVLGLLLFAITRSKKNPNRYLKWYQCQFIAYWASFAPGLLSMVLGFIMPNYAVMFFIMFMGLRAMWISMKQLSSNYQQA